jgi:hypothetical protein
MATKIKGTRADYLGLCHSSPETVRHLRGALDLGENPATLRRIIRRFAKREGWPQSVTDAALGTLDYLLTTPTAGVVKWDGMQYEFRDRMTQE